MNLTEIIAELNRISSPKKAAILQKFFKTGKGQYAENEIFIGIEIPKLRNIAKKLVKEIVPKNTMLSPYNFQQNLLLDSTKEAIFFLLDSNIHEQKILAILILLEIIAKDDSTKTLEEISNFYLEPQILNNINNWDLVDLSCHKIIGKDLYISPSKKDILYQLALSKNFWHRRIAIVSTLYFIRHNSFADTIKISQILLKDQEPLINKACGWLLREVGKKSIADLESFVESNIGNIPAITLSYLCEKMSHSQRLGYQQRNKSQK